MSTIPAEQPAAGLRASKAINELQTALTEESWLLLRSLLGDFIRSEVANGVEEALTRIQPDATKGPRK